MASRKLKIGLVQMSMKPSPLDNLSKAVAMTGTAASQGAEIVCLPELFMSRYFAQHDVSDAVDLTELAVKIPGSETETLSQCAKENKVTLVAGSLYELDRGRLFNTSCVFGPSGRMIGKYRKTHIPQDESYYEQSYFAPGDTGFKIFPIAKVRIGVNICYDQWFPEAARCEALLGADVLFYPTAIGHVKSISEAEGDWQTAWENVMRGHAIANSFIVVAVNRVGTEEDMRFWGGSFVIDAFGRTIARAGSKEQVVVVETDSGHSEMVRKGWRFFPNRRPECYGKIVEGLGKEDLD
ncbi:MAG TPA: nitrilase-related carbon-nitrogen hydrolase [Methanomassiliicoccales archaeon]|nr:nitrilase-related carbon-nitrogen hydrolase [Methanomassiliicoccales archaeon]